MELLFDFFEDHEEAAAAVRARRPLALGVLCYLLGALSFCAAWGVSGLLSPLPFGWFTLCLFMLWELGAGFALVALLHLIVEMEGAQGSAAGLFVLFGMANLVWALALPLALVLIAACPRAHWPLTAAFLLAGCYSLSLKARSLQDVYQVSAGRAWVTIIPPYLAALAASGLAFSLAALFSQLAKAFG